MSLSSDEIKTLKVIHELFLQIEKNSQDERFNEQDLFKLGLLLTSLEVSENPNIAKLSEIRDHLHPKMTLRHFSNFMIPIERCLDREMKDNDFLITSQDKKSDIAANIQVSTQRSPLVFVLDNIRSSFNVGAIFRTADCVGAEKIILCGYTATPENETLKKTSMNTTEVIRWEHQNKVADAIEKLKAEGYQVIALETAANSSGLYDFIFKKKTALVVGNERFGLDRETLSLVDAVVSIPLYGFKNSLNVSNAVAVTAFEWRRQWRQA